MSVDGDGLHFDPDLVGVYPPATDEEIARLFSIMSERFISIMLPEASVDQVLDYLRERLAEDPNAYRRFLSEARELQATIREWLSAQNG